MAKVQDSSGDKKRKATPRRKRKELISLPQDAPAAGLKETGGRAGDGEIDFPIVGIGASAGGLEAFEQFFTHMPPDSGMAFVVVQHLDPTHKSILVDLIRSYTRMAVNEVEDGMKVEPNSIYVIPPNADMAILHDRLHLMIPAAPRGLRQPIDFFLRSLSADRKERAICIVLSGSGTEGTLGSRDIKGQGGMVMVQDPSTAKYDGMPRSAIATGLVDYILSPEKMPEQLIAYVRHPLTKKSGTPPEAELEVTNSVQKMLIIIRSKTGQDFSLYKQSTIVRRIERRMAIHEITNRSDYIRYLQKYPEEVDTLFKELLIGVTNFFRDQEAFEILKEKVIPLILKEKNEDGGTVRVWVSGCSTGEEAYSLAILFQEHLEQTKRDIKVQVFATDIDSGAIETARQGLYPHGIAVDVSPERLRRFFSKQDGAYRVKKTVRDVVVFAVQNVVTDPPFSKIDLISCRNLLIYMGSELQKRVLPIFHYSLAKGGFLFLGTSETVGQFSDLFSALDRKWKIFRRKEAEFTGMIPVEIAPRAEMAPIPTLGGRRLASALTRPTNRDLVERELLDSYQASGVLIDEKADILYFHGLTTKFLHPPVGEANFNLLAMARDSVRMEVANAIRKALSTKDVVRHHRIRAKADGREFCFNLVVRPVWEPPSKRGLFMVIFEEIASDVLEERDKPISHVSDTDTDVRVKQLDHELASTKEYLQTTIAELETSNEELKSTNEELQSANEELQSTNEELETSKEEQQSVNEELVTVNSELQQKIDALSKANDDMNNLLAATDIGTIFLDTRLNIQRFTPPAQKIINFIDSDVGRPVRHLVHNLDYQHLVRDVEEVLRTVNTKETEVRSTSGNWYSMRVLPYRTKHNLIEGVVVTFIDITDRKRAELELLESEQRYRSIGELVSGMWTCSPDGLLTYMSESFLSMLGLRAEDCDGTKWLEKMQVKDMDHLLAEWRQCAENQGSWSHQFSVEDASGNHRTILARGVPVKDEHGLITSWVGINLDITEVNKSGGSCSRAMDPNSV